MVEELRARIKRLSQRTVDDDSIRLSKHIARGILQEFPGGSLTTALTSQLHEGKETSENFKVIFDVLLGLLDTQLEEDEIKQLRTILSAFENPKYGQLSPNSKLICEHIANVAIYGHGLITLLQLADLRSKLKLPQEEFGIAIDELLLNGYVRPADLCGECDAIWPENKLFWETDNELYNWSTEQNAYDLAKALVGYEGSTVVLGVLQQLLDWPIRKLNPAASFLVEHLLADAGDHYSYADYVYSTLTETPATREFVRNWAI